MYQPDSDLLLQLAKKYGTPLYIYDGDLIVQRYRELYDFIAWPDLRILYAMKANYSAGILRLLREQDAWLDTVSPAEVLLARKLGFPASHILYTANNMTDTEVSEVHASGVRMNIGSLSRLTKIARDFPGSRVCLRFNPDVVAGENEKVQTGGDLTKFGILLEDADQAVAIARRGNLQIVGLHEHTGSGIAETEKVFQSIRNLLAIADAKRFPDLTFIDFGGGFKVPYHPNEKRIDYPSFGRELARIFGVFCEEYGRRLQMYFEPGKYIVAESGILLTTINTLKNNRGRLIAGTDSGFPQLIRPMLYNAYHPIANLSNPDGPCQPCDICGNICETGDRFAADRELPEPREGDVLAIGNAGAYCYAMGGVYNLRAMPTEILLRNGREDWIRPRLSNQQLVEQILSEEIQ